MRVCVLSPSYEDSISIFSGLDPPCDPSRWMHHLPEYQFESHFIKKATAMHQIRALVQSKRFDVFLNLCDGAWDEDRAGIEVVKALEMFRVPFTGASSDFYEPSKEIMKMVATYEGVKTPPFVFAYDETDVDEAVQNLNFKMIVKHFNGYSSIGMTKRSVCETAEDLHREAGKFIADYGGALIEEFIEGREATVLVVENPDDPSDPISLLPVECCFPPGENFKHFDLKWCEFDGLIWKPIEEPELVCQLKEAARRIFLGLKGVSYGRCDMRICAKTGDVHFLEMNPNCGIFYPADSPGSADCILQFDPMRHCGFIEHILKAAIQRHQRLMATVPKCTVRFSPKLGYNLCATVDIAAGSVVIPYEERPHYLVSKNHVVKRWTGQKKQWFSQYAWPLSDQIYVMWSDKPEEWRPMNHSCNPNTWLAGQGSLDLVARRDIAAREQITVDYSTFCGDDMEAFDCACGAVICRKRIQGTDYKNPKVRALYGTHVSAFILAQDIEQGTDMANGYH